MYKNVKRATRPNTASQSTPPGTATTSEFGFSRLGDGSDDYETLFKQLFCIAANNLAATLHDTLGNMGVLFGDICNTGTVNRSNGMRRLVKKLSAWIGRRHSSNINQAERGSAQRKTFSSSSGQLLFLVRRMGKSEAGKLGAIGYKFAPITHVVENLARSLEITTRELLPRLEQMRGIAGKEMLFEAGVHLACFAVRPIFRKGFDVLVRKDAKNLLPTARLPISKLSMPQFNFLRQFDGLTAAACLAKLRRRSTPTSREEDFFCRMFFDALIQLKVQLNDTFFDEATLAARVLIAPCPQISSSQRLEYASLLAFRTITDVHGIGNIDKRYQYIPCPFFLTEQKVYQGFSDIERFANEVREGFGRRLRRADSAFDSIFSPGQSSNEDGSENRSNRYRLSAHIARTRKFPFVARIGRPAPRDEYSSVRSLMGLNSSGILFGNEASTSIDEVHGGNSPEIEMVTFGDSRRPNLDRRSYAEELMLMTVQDRRRPRQIARSSRYLSNNN